MTGRRHPSRGKRPPGGVVALEILLLLPLLLILLVGVVGLVDLIAAEQTLDEAAGVGARVLAAGGTDDEVVAAVQAVLGNGRTERAIIRAIRDTADGQPIPPGGLVEVRVELEARYAITTAFAPVARGRTLVSRSVMPRQ